MARPRKLWKHSEGTYGGIVTIREPSLGAPLRWDYRDSDGKRTRPEVSPRIVVRPSKDAPVDVILEKRAIELCKQKHAELTLAAGETAPPKEEQQLTVGKAYALYFDPKRKALPPSDQAKKHHAASRAFWTAELGAETSWDQVAPADVWGALLRLKEAGQVPTAEKRFNNLRTLYRWLRDRMGYDTLRDPLRTLDKKALVAGHKPRRPRYTSDEVEKIIAKAPEFGERFNLFVVLMADSGARAIQVRMGMRSRLNCDLEPPPAPGFAPHGWLLLDGVKGQEPMLIAFTKRQRAAVDAALATYLAEWEAKYQAGELEDYPLIPGDRGGNHGARPLQLEPISDTALRTMWRNCQKAAGVPPRPRLAFHGSRRSWSDDIFEAEGLDTLTAAGGWSKRDTPESIYLSKAKYSHIERARKRRERPE